MLVDPFRPGGLGGRFRLPPITVAADVVAITHYHEDHSWLDRAQARAVVADATGTFLGLEVTTVPAYHDRELGTRMGLVSMLAFSLGGLRVVHLGDVGVEPTPGQWRALGQPDVLLVPAGGTFTLGPAEAAEVARASGASWVVPMHCADLRVELPLRPVEEFLEAWGGAALHLEGPSVRLDATERPSAPVVLHFEASRLASPDPNPVEGTDRNPLTH